MCKAPPVHMSSWMGFIKHFREADKLEDSDKVSLLWSMSFLFYLTTDQVDIFFRYDNFLKINFSKQNGNSKRYMLLFLCSQIEIIFILLNLFRELPDEFLCMGARRDLFVCFFNRIVDYREGVLHKNKNWKYKSTTIY